jgi:hypothetical protein
MPMSGTYAFTGRPNAHGLAAAIAGLLDAVPMQGAWACNRISLKQGLVVRSNRSDLAHHYENAPPEASNACFLQGQFRVAGALRWLAPTLRSARRMEKPTLVARRGDGWVRVVSGRQREHTAHNTFTTIG